MILDDHFGMKYAGIRIYCDEIEDVYFQISFLSEYKDFYLEIYNDYNQKIKGKNPKEETNLKYYEEKLNSKCRSLGQIQNVSTAWLGDWVCKYTKLDNYFLSENGWGDLADKNYEMANITLEEISPIIDAMIESLSKK